MLALQKGLITAFVYQLAMNGTRLGLYDYLRRSVSSHFEGAEKNFFVNISLAVRVLCCFPIITFTGCTRL